jgi:MraZ protein
VSGYLGQYEFQLDEKGRVSLPSAFRRGAEESSYILLQYERPYLSLFPEETWRDVQGRLMEYRKAGPEAAAHVRRIAAGAVEVTPDRQGRILIPSRLQELASLNGGVLLLGNFNRIELWNPEIYRQTETATEGGGDFQAFAHQLFGL